MNNPHKGRTGVDRVLRAFGYSMQGMGTAVRVESAFRQEAALAVVMLPAAFWLGRSWIEVALLVGSVLLVLIVELLNSAIEAVVDRVSFDLHELSKRAKDYGSAAVFFALLWCGGIWATAAYQRWMA
ncbi:MAG: diacylglycerol kinase [Aquabacterium sp.]|nr:diacylglycerol kinase [Aquabacterium sp.]